MKITFPLPTDNKIHRYCQKCHSEEIEKVIIDSKEMFKCNKCGGIFNRNINIDPKIKWWVDPDTKEYWHESVGVFVTNPKKELLLIERTLYPYAFTIPAGHVDTGENPKETAQRELWEETGIKTASLIHFKDMDIEYDPCIRGADKHRWLVYKYLLKEEKEIVPDISEGKNPKWLSLTESLQNKLTPPVLYLLKKFGDKLLS